VREQSVPGGLLSLLPIEEYDDALRVCWHFVPRLDEFRQLFRRELDALDSSPPAPWKQAQFWREVEVGGQVIVDSVTLRDDAGTPYSVLLRSGGGNARTLENLTGSVLFSPSLNPIAGNLQVEVLGALFVVPILGNATQGEP
jgi:hypothetical protein